MNQQQLVAHCYKKAEHDQDPAKVAAIEAKRVAFEAIANLAYAAMTQDYIDLGQVDRDEVEHTVRDNAFCQMGVVTPKGLRDLFELPQMKAKGSTRLDLLSNPESTFLDVGSGVGNINLQVFAETAVGRSIGIELLPSRHKWAELAKSIVKFSFPDLFEALPWASRKTRDLDFILADFCDPSDENNKQVAEAFGDATLIFSHNRMFDDRVVKMFGYRILSEAPKARCIISQRPVPPLDALMRKWDRKLVFLETDWLRDAEFFVYMKKVTSDEM